MRQKKQTRSILIRTLIVITFIIIGLAGGIIVGTMRNLPAWDADKLYGQEGSQVYDQKGDAVFRFHAQENRTLVPYEKIPPNLVNAFLATEDTEFFQHHGVNLKAIARAVFVDVISGSKAQGASTITQQLARSAYLTTDKSYERKIREIVLAVQLERHYTKKEIMEMYLNKVLFGGSTYGVQAAANVYFGKDVTELNLAECTLIAGRVQSPNAYSPFNDPERAKKRQKQVLNRMVTCNFISEAEAEKAYQTELKYNTASREGYQYGAFMDNVMEESQKILAKKGYSQPNSAIYFEGLRIYTTMNTEVQQLAEDIYANKANFPSFKNSKGNNVQSGMAIVDHHTGAISARAGGRDYTTQRGFNRATMAKRQPGSAFKPLVVYAPALEAGYMPNLVLEDSLKSYNQGNGQAWTPQNYDGVYLGPITMREAVKRSINTYAVKLADLVGIKNGLDLAENAGISTLVRAGAKNDYNLSTALGGITQGVTPLELATAYGVFANEGKYVTPHSVTKIVDANGIVLYEAKYKPEKAMESSTAWLVSSLLKSVVYDPHGTGARGAVTGMVTGGKTGTTSDKKDVWFAGITPYYSCAVWIGFDNNETMKGKAEDTFGGKHPALIFNKIMTKAVKGKPAKDFTKPDNIVEVQVCTKSGLLPSQYCPASDIVTEYVVQGKEPIDICPHNFNTATPGQRVTYVCAETSLLATVNCPQALAKGEADFWPDAAPRDYCDIHPGAPYTGESQEATREVTICRDAKHQGKLYLANRPGPDEKGGCDSRNLETITVPASTVISHCDLPEHKIKQP
ncbi:MAG: transglycosylase domain-containing protein [Methanomassiliicoccales archaeon]